MITPKQGLTIARFEDMGYKPTCTRIPVARGALLVQMPGKLVDHLDLTVNTDGSYHHAWDDE